MSGCNFGRLKAIKIFVIVSALVVGTIFAALSSPGSNGQITATITTYGGLNYILPGDTFNVTIGIDHNTGFTGMMLRLGIPQGMEIVGLRLHSLPKISDGFRGVSGWDGAFAISPPITDYAFVGWSRAENFKESGDLLTFTIRAGYDVMPGYSASLTLAFANAMNFETPTDANGDSFIAFLPGEIMNCGLVAEIGTVNVKAVSITVMPNRRAIVNRTGASAYFDFTVRGLPPNQYFCIAHPVCLLGLACPGYANKNRDIGITITGFPEFLAISGVVRTGANGAGTSTFTVELMPEN